MPRVCLKPPCLVLTAASCHSPFALNAIVRLKSALSSSVRMDDFANLVQRETIDLCSRNLGDGDLEVLTKVLRESKVLQKMWLSDNRVTLADGKFTDALAENCTLRFLHLGDNHIGNEGAKRLADALMVNGSLEEVYLGSNAIGVEGAKSVAEALVANRTLATIDLARNKIGDDGAQTLAASLLANESLELIDLGGNQINDKGAKSLANALRCNCTVKRIWMHGNQICDDVIDDVKGILAAWRAIQQKMNGWGNPRRKDTGGQQGALGQLQRAMSYIEEKSEEISRLKQKIAVRDEELAAKGEQIASLKAPFDQMKTIMETIDLSSGRNAASNKRPREEESNLATIHRKNQKIACVKQEKATVEESLANVIEEKEAVEADLEEVRGDLDDEKETVKLQLRATDIWQGRFDDLARRAAAGPVDGAVIAEIRNRSLASGS